MFHHNSNNEDDYPTGPNSSKLSSLFTESSSQKLSDLKYVAPKQPQKNLSSVQRDSVVTKSTNVLYASAISLFLHDKGMTINHGRAMCCITRNEKDGIFALIIYKTKRQVITCTVIHHSFNVMIQSNNFASFTDEKNIQWSVHISTTFEEFLTQIGICRAILAFRDPSASFHVVQDITVGEGKAAQAADSVKINYCSWQVQNFRRGVQLEKQQELKQLILNKPSTSWEMGLIGSQKDLKRIIFVKSNQAYSDDESLMVAYEVAVEKIYDKENDSLMSSSPEETLPGRDKLSSSSGMSPPVPPSKAALISRMAKVGQALPVARSCHQDILTDSESEVEDLKHPQLQRFRNPSTGSSVEEVTSSSQSHKINSNMHSEYSLPENLPQNVVPYPQGFAGFPQASCNQYGPMHSGGALVSYHSMPFAQLQHSQPPASGISSESILSLLLSESRSQNTDLRVTLAQLSSKVDQIVAKVNLKDTQDVTSFRPVTTMASSRLDPNEFLHQITALVQENDDLKKQIETKNEKIESLTDRYTEIMHKNQKLLEEKADLITQKGEIISQERTRIGLQEVLALQEEKVHLVNQLKMSQERVDHLETEMEKAKSAQSDMAVQNDSMKGKLEEEEKRSNELQRKLSAQVEDATTLQSSLEKLQESFTTISSSNKVLDEDKRALDSVVKQLKGSVDSLQQERDSLKQNVRKFKDELDDAAVQSKDWRLKAEELERTCRQLEEKAKENNEKEDTSSQHYKHLWEEKNAELQLSFMHSSQLEADFKDLSEREARERRQSRETIAELKERMKSLEAASKDSGELASRVKQIMNATYKKFKQTFASSSSYDGAHIMQTVLAVIRDTTLQYLENGSSEFPSTITLNMSCESRISENDKTALSVNTGESEVSDNEKLTTAVDSPDYDDQISPTVELVENNENSPSTAESVENNDRNTLTAEIVENNENSPSTAEPVENNDRIPLMAEIVENNDNTPCTAEPVENNDRNPLMAETKENNDKNPHMAESEEVVCSEKLGIVEAEEIVGDATVSTTSQSEEEINVVPGDKQICDESVKAIQDAKQNFSESDGIHSDKNCVERESATASDSLSYTVGAAVQKLNAGIDVVEKEAKKYTNEREEKALQPSAERDRDSQFLVNEHYHENLQLTTELPSTDSPVSEIEINDGSLPCSKVYSSSVNCLQSVSQSVCKDSPLPDVHVSTPDRKEISHAQMLSADADIKESSSSLANSLHNTSTNTSEEVWRPVPPPPPLFSDSEDDDWLP